MGLLGKNTPARRICGWRQSPPPMNETIRKQLVNDHFLFKSGDPNLKVGGIGSGAGGAERTELTPTNTTSQY